MCAGLALLLCPLGALSGAASGRVRPLRASALARLAPRTTCMAAVGDALGSSQGFDFDVDDIDDDDDDVFGPSEGLETEALVPSDPFYSEEVLISSPDVPTLRITRPSNDAVLEQLMAQFQKEAMAEPARFNQIMQMRVEEAVRQRPRTWYWSLVWPSAVALCRWMSLDGAARLEGRRVLDLGAGIGVAGIGAAALGGAANVVLADADARALLYAEHSAQVNGVSSRVTCTQFDWTADWPADMRASFSALMLSDVLYDADAADPIARCAVAALQPGGVIILADQVDRPYDSAARRAALCAALERHSPAAEGARWDLASSTEVSVEWDSKTHLVQIAVLSRGASM